MRSKRKNNDNNKDFESWVMVCGHALIFTRGCSCFNSFYLVLILFGMLYRLLCMGLSMRKATNVRRKTTFVIPKATNVRRKTTFVIPKATNPILAIRLIK